MAIASNQMEIAFANSLSSQASATRSMASSPKAASTWPAKLGALLDPLADKAHAWSRSTWTLGIWGAVPRWIVILVVSPDIHDRSRRDCVVVIRQADPDEAADVIEAPIRWRRLRCAALVLAALGFRLQLDAV